MPTMSQETITKADLVEEVTRVITDLKRNARWWVPWLLMAAMSYAMVAVVASKIGFGQVSENQMKMNPSQMERLEKAKENSQFSAQFHLFQFYLRSRKKTQS